MNTTPNTDPILPRLAHAIAPSHLSKGQACVQCGADAWYFDGLFFCRSHDQTTYAAFGICECCGGRCEADGSPGALYTCDESLLACETCHQAAHDRYQAEYCA
jgi:hypothetical protein